MIEAIQSTITNTQNGLAASKTAKAIDNIQSLSKDEKKAEAAAKEFEAVFISQMLTPMFEGIETDGIFGGGHAEKIYQSMMIEEYGKLITQTGGLGISDSVKAQIIELQSKQNVSLGDLKDAQ